MRKNDTQFPRYPGYMSYETCGIDTKQFFVDAGSTIAEVSRETGISRKTLSALPADYGSMETAIAAADYLEKKNAADYEKIVRECIDEVQEIKKKLEGAWDDYLNRKKVIAEFKIKRGIERDGSEQRMRQTIVKENWREIFKIL